VIAALVPGVGAQANADETPDAPAGQQEPATGNQSAENLAKQLINPVTVLIACLSNSTTTSTSGLATRAIVGR
jgi:hypothetical protein